MNRALCRGWLFALTTVAFQVVVGSANADVAANELHVFQQLASPTELEETECPLDEVITYLAEMHDIKILLDGKELKKAGIDASALPITKKTMGRLDDTLNEILTPFDLSFMIDGGVLWITTRAKAKEWQKTYARNRGLK